MSALEVAGTIFRQFSSVEPESIQVLRDKNRIVAEIVTSSHSYFLKGEQQTTIFIENLIGFVYEMRKKGLPFVAFEKTKEGRCFDRI